jgi:glucose/arabinose dehydrogenase
MRTILRRIIGTTLATMLIGAALPGGVAAGGPPTLNTEVVQSGLNYPWDVAFTPDGRMIVTERGGTLKVYASGEPGAPLLHTNTVGYVQTGGEAGLMGVAVDLNFATNQRIYICASRNDYGRWLNQVLRYRIDQWQRIIYEGFLIRFGMNAGTIHNGCAIEMFSDGNLWVTMGDSGNMALAQNPNSYNGKVLRVTPFGGVPPTNPVIGGRRSHIFSMGHRNPQGIATQPGSGAVYAVEHGPNLNDEINRIYPGSNYGWPCYTGNGVRNTAYAGPCSAASAYRGSSWASGAPPWATSNGVFVNSANWGTWNGQFVVATLREQDLRHFSVSGITMIWDGQQYLNDTWRKRAVVRGPDGSLYFTTSNGSSTDRVVRVTPAP